MPYLMKRTWGISMFLFTGQCSLHMRVGSTLYYVAGVSHNVVFDIGGIFRLELFLPEDYPMTPPKIRFLTKIYHPNIDRLGRICLDVLKSKYFPWSLGFFVDSNGLTITCRQLVSCPANPHNPALDPSPSWSTQPWRPSCERCCSAMEGGWTSCHKDRKRVDYNTCYDLEYREDKSSIKLFMTKIRTCFTIRLWRGNGCDHRHFFFYFSLSFGTGSGVLFVSCEQENSLPFPLTWLAYSIIGSGSFLQNRGSFSGDLLWVHIVLPGLIQILISRWGSSFLSAKEVMPIPPNALALDMAYIPWDAILSQNLL